MADIAPSRKILKNKDEIKAFLGGISDYKFNRFRKLEINGKKYPIPANKIDGQWVAYTDHIEKWWAIITYFDSSRIPDEADSGQ